MATLNYSWQELGRVTFYSSGSTSDTVSIEGRITAQSTANNTTTLQLRWVNIGSWWRTTNGTVAFTGTYDDEESCATYPDRINNGDVFFQIEKTAAHGNDGNLTIYVGGTITAYVGGASRTGTISQVSVSLPKIDRFATITGAVDFNDEGNPYMTFTNPGGFRINGRLEFGGTSISRDNIANTGSYTFELTAAERNLLRQACTGKTMTVRYVVATCLSETTESGWSVLDKTMTIVNGNPTLTSYTEEETDETILEVFGGQPNKIIRYASDLLFTITASANKYATISSVTVNGVAATYDNGVYKATITNATATDYSIVVTDSRGYLATDTFTSTIVNYIPPNINSNWTVERASQVSSDLVLNATIDAFNEDLDTNITNSVVVQYSMDNETWTTIPSSSYTYANNKITISNLTLSNLISYQSAGTFYLKTYDLLRTHQDNKSIPRGIETFSYGESDLQVNGDLFVADVNGDNPVNVLNAINTNTTNISTLTPKVNYLYPHVLFQSGGTQGNITLNEAVENYDIIEIFFHCDGYFNSIRVKVWQAARGITLLNPFVNEYNTLYLYASSYYASGTNIIFKYALNAYITASGAVSNYGTGSYIQIYQVIGYK